ncbi:histidine phosphatase family protein [Acidovorax soli]|uniref:histidine phosphatase family protein n=1 Tax=Acidovorax TaxID=12916 RepID=UPI0026EE10AA|nr:histidine phosphatase family protein [Acidovorax soli]MCM2346434.1 histidine phosphatase family protein [Acidovorax soli]
MSPPAGARLWLVRHAQPLVAPGTCYGAVDVPADAAATRVAAQRLADALPPKARVFHSTLQRCALLAHDLQALRPDLASNPDARLREMDFGHWEGRAWEHIGKTAIDAWTAAFATYAPGGGESLSAMLARVSLALRAAQPQPAKQAAQDVVWITHAGVARCVAWLQARGDGVWPRPEQWPAAAPAWGEWEIRNLDRLSS